MIKVYFETPNNSYAELVAIFTDEDTYIECLFVLEEMADKANMIVTESLTEENIDDL